MPDAVTATATATPSPAVPDVVAHQVEDTTPGASVQDAKPPEERSKTERARGADGRFKPGEETPTAQPTPKKWKLGDREVDDPNELYAIASRQAVDEEAFSTLQNKAKQADELIAALKSGRLADVIGVEAARKFAVSIAAQWKAEEEERNLPPEERERRELKRKLEAYEREKAEAEKKKKETEQERLDREEGERAVATIKEAMAQTGLPQTNGLARRVAAKMYANVQSGRNYPAHVVADQVRKDWLAEQREAYKALSPAQLLGMLPELVEKLDALEDAGLLTKFPKLGERLRRLNLEQLGAKPPAERRPTTPAAPAPAKLPDGREPQTAQEWDRYFKLRAEGKL